MLLNNKMLIIKSWSPVRNYTTVKGVVDISGISEKIHEKSFDLNL